jgi:predicted alpha/beta superfamily hydrolase
MKMFKILAVFLLLLAGACASPSKLEKKFFKFNNDDVSLEIEILLPDSYVKSGNKTYPVLYVLDGFWNKDSINIAYDNLRFDNTIPEIIIVSIGYPKHIKDVEEQRMWDLTPVYDSGFKAGGNAQAMFDLITEEITPFIDKNYKVNKKRSILTGHSLAGLFTLYVMYKDPKAFTHYAAISPSALWANNALSNIDSNYAGNNNNLPTNLYITYETDEYVPYVKSLENYIHQLENRNYEKLNLSLAKVEGLGHVGMKSEGFLRGIVWSLFDIRPDGPSGFEKKNLDAQKNIGYPK